MTAAKYNNYKNIPSPIEALGIELVANQNIAIAAQGVEMEFKSQKRCFQILKDIDLAIPQGNIQLLMGPSGSGKTTLLSILAGLMTPTRGKVSLLGEDITKMSRQKLTKFRQQNIGFIFQNFNLFPALTASENVEVALNIKGIRKNAKYQAHLLLEQVGLENQSEQKPCDLSGGQKQRVAIARALAGSPQLIMADEPTAALDSKSGHAVITLLRSLAKEQGCTVLMVTHDPRIVDVADSVTYLEDGALKE
ncbi:ABC transporter ATP-binding protein [Synechocystis sp. PCC 7509]|uniref:ABC transporter ATP-binding protein n=1 Tax=Synechocystis sp. PCC 7509 TaxID=927677 RepID=UPI0002AD04F1|nr:ABC transporter ATP-binding protein [Synechocystis sp. PCC 7509]